MYRFTSQSFLQEPLNLQWLGKNSTCPMCRILLVPPDQRGEGETDEEAVGGGNPAVAEPAASATQEVRIEMIQV